MGRKKPIPEKEKPPGGKLELINAGVLTCV